MKRILLILIALRPALRSLVGTIGIYPRRSPAPRWRRSCHGIQFLSRKCRILTGRMTSGSAAIFIRCNREPAVQDFLRKPLSNVPKSDAISQTLREIEQLAPKNAFIALTSMENNNPKAVGGFRFRGSREEAERIIGRWHSALMGQNSNLKREKVQYQRHEIEVTKAAPFSVATVYDPPWFLAATDVPELETLLDRADRRWNPSRE